jgi:anaerobic selenocysteine-containing dehydrogenase
VLIELGARLGLPAFVDSAGAPRFPGGYKDYIALHERQPGVGPLAGWRGDNGEAHGKGAPNPTQLDRYIANGCFWKHQLPPEQLFFKHANKAYLENAVAMGLIAAPEPIVLQLYVEPLQRFRLAAQGHGASVPPEKDRARIETYFDPLPFWYPPFEEARIEPRAFPLHAITQRPMQMYHSWHSQNAWLRQILGQNRLFINRATARGLGLADDDWVWVSSHAGRIKAQLKLMDGVNPDTVWTWNAIGKRSGAWNLAADSPEFARGFLLNHLITETLPTTGRGDGEAVADPGINADPITGQAAWYDLRVRVEKVAAAQAGHSALNFPTLARAPSLPRPPEILRYGSAPETRREPQP